MYWMFICHSFPDLSQKFVIHILICLHKILFENVLMIIILFFFAAGWLES